LYQAFSVLSYVSREDPPLLILQGTNDPVVAVSQSEALARVLKKHGVTHHLEIIENAPHSFDLQPEQRDLRPQVFEFFDHWLQNPQRVR
jgi:dipeptidyl aminopeptidase/acylaminoacyl peptidase